MVAGAGLRQNAGKKAAPQTRGLPTIRLQLSGVALPHPVDELIGGGHGGEAALADERPIVELAGLLDFGEGGGRIEAAGKLKVYDGGLGVFGVVARRGTNGSQADDAGHTAAVVDEDMVAGLHGADGAHRLGIGDAIPDRFMFAFEVIDGVRFRIGLRQEPRHSY